MNLREIDYLRKLVYVWRGFEEKRSYTKGKGNIFQLGGAKIKTRIQVNGMNNQIKVEQGCLLKNTLIKIEGNNNKLIIHGGAYISGAELWIEDNNCVIEIGERTFVGHHSHLACTEDGSKLVVGSDGLISSYVQLRTGDSHSILDLEGNRINPADSISIGDHVWIGEGVKVLKGVTLEGDDVVSTGAIVTKSFGKNVLLGGIPAKVLKENVSWDSKRL